MLSEAQQFWDAISGKVKQLIRSETQSAMRCERYEVTTAPDGTKVGVTLPMGDNEIFLPYSAEVADADVGDPVLVVWWHSMSNAKVYYFANGFAGTNNSGTATTALTTDTITDTTNSYGNIFTTLGESSIIFSAIRTGTTASVCTPFWNESTSVWGIHVASMSGSAVTSTSVTVKIVYIEPGSAGTLYYLVDNGGNNLTDGDGNKLTITI